MRGGWRVCFGELSSNYYDTPAFFRATLPLVSVTTAKSVSDIHDILARPLDLVKLAPFDAAPENILHSVVSHGQVNSGDRVLLIASGAVLPKEVLTFRKTFLNRVSRSGKVRMLCFQDREGSGARFWSEGLVLTQKEARAIWGDAKVDRWFAMPDGVDIRKDAKIHPHVFPGLAEDHSVLSNQGRFPVDIPHMGHRSPGILDAHKDSASLRTHMLKSVIVPDNWNKFEWTIQTHLPFTLWVDHDAAKTANQQYTLGASVRARVGGPHGFSMADFSEHSDRQFHPLEESRFIVATKDRIVPGNGSSPQAEAITQAVIRIFQPNTYLI